MYDVIDPIESIICSLVESETVDGRTQILYALNREILRQGWSYQLNSEQKRTIRISLEMVDDSKLNVMFSTLV